MPPVKKLKRSTAGEKTAPAGAINLGSKHVDQLHLKEKVCAMPHVELPYLPLEVGNLKIPALLDTGSTRNLISKKVFESLDKRVIKVEEPCRLGIATAKANQALKTLKMAKIKIKVANYSWVCPFLVVEDLQVDSILGMEFILKTNVITNLPEKWIAFCFPKERQKNPFYFSERIPIETCFVRQTIPKVNDPPFSLQAESPPQEGPDLSHLTTVRANKASQILSKYPSVLTKKLGKTHLIDYEIELTDDIPVRSPPYPLGPPKMEVTRELIRKLEQDDVAERSTSNYSSPAFPVPKPNGAWRLVVDYRKLNQKVKFESIPIPDIKTAFSFFGNAKYFVVIDLNQAYHQIPLSARSKLISAFCVPWNLYQYKRVPFGLSVGGCVLTRLVDMIFHDLKYKNLVNYLDDIVIYAETFEELMRILDEVLSRLEKAGLTINPSKLQVAVEKFIFLGHAVSYRSVEIDPARTQPIRDFVAPTTVKGVARFIGMIGFFSKFIPHFAEKAAPLNALRKKNCKFVWGEEESRAFQILKDAITHPPVLCVPDFQRTFILQTDASSRAIGASLLQEIDGVRMPVAFYSKRLTESESKYSTPEHECLAAILAMEHFAPFLEHRQFELETDNQALSWLLSHPRQRGRLARWVLRISSFNYKAIHIRGTQNVIADTLSRMFDDQPQSSLSDQRGYDAVADPKADVKVKMVVEPLEPSCFISSAELTNFPLAFTDLETHQKADAELGPIINRLKQGEAINGYSLSKGVLCFTPSRSCAPRIVAPPLLRPMLFKFYHESLLGGHLGCRKTISKIQQLFTFKGLASEVKDMVRACQVCAMSKPGQREQIGSLSSEVASAPMERVFADFVGPLVRTARGHKFILTMVDAFTKFTWLIPTSTSTADVLVREYQRVFKYFGYPKSLATDNGKQFTSNKAKRYMFNRGIKHVLTCPYRPNPNQAERVNRNIKSALIAYHSQNQTRWDESLDWLVQAFNSARHEAHKFTPHDLMFTYKNNSPLALQWNISDLLPDNPTEGDLKENWQRAKRNLLTSHQKRKRVYDATRKEHGFKTGDLVFAKLYPQSNKVNKIMAKLSPRFEGPLQIMRFTSPVSVLLSDPVSGQIKRRAHVTQLKRYHPLNPA